MTMTEHDEARERHYRILLRRGIPERHARRLATGYLVGLGLRTTTEWLSRHGTLLNQFGDTPDGRRNLNSRIAAAKRAGYTPNMNDVYDPTIAASPGDPDGFIPSSDADGHVRRVIAERGVGCQEGLVTAATPAPSEEPKKTKLDEKIVNKLTRRRIRANPDLAAKDQQALREEVIDTHSYSRG